MASKTDIYNLGLLRLGEEILTDAEITTNTEPRAIVCTAIYALVLDETLAMSKEKGWLFANARTSDVGVDNTAITAFADYSGTVSGTVSATSTAHGLITGDLVTIKDGSIGAYDGEEVVTRIDANSFYFTATFSATETATVQWTSERKSFRFPALSSNGIFSVSVGGLEITDWVKEGQFILTSQEDEDVDMEYIHLGTDLTVTNFPPHFVKVLYMNMAVHLAYDLVQSRAIAEDLKIEVENIVLPRAIGLDAREQFVQEEDNSWQEAGH